MPRLARLGIAIIVAGSVASCSQSDGSGTAFRQTRYPRTHYRLVWHDEFNGPAGAVPDPAVWLPVTGKPTSSNGELETYTEQRSNYSLNGRGDLAITARRSKGGYTSAKIETLRGFHVRYGRIEARIKVPRGAGLWPAFWMLGTNYPQVGWPRAGELDPMELVGSKPNLLVGTVHGPKTNNRAQWQQNVYARTVDPLSASFHVYGIDWSRTEITFTLDGAPYGEVRRSALHPNQRWVFDHPYYLVLDLAVGGRFPGPPNARTQFPARMLVDWVRVWKPVRGSR